MRDSDRTPGTCTHAELENIRPWDLLHADIGDCLACGSTVVARPWKIGHDAGNDGRDGFEHSERCTEVKREASNNPADVWPNGGSHAA